VIVLVEQAERRAFTETGAQSYLVSGQRQKPPSP